MSSKNVEDAYPLTPMQEGLLFHSLYARGEGVYVTHITCTFEGLDVAAFEAAWQRAVDRHPALRTAFVWEGLPRPLQVVGRQVKLRVEQDDWRQLSVERQEAEWEAQLEAARRRDFKLSKAPLVRLSLFRLTETTYRFLYSHHHILLDGWSDFLLLKEVATLYAAHLRGEQATLPLPRPFRDYIALLQKRDPAQAESFWRRYLGGFRAANQLPAHHATGEPPSRAERSGEFRLGEELTGRLRSFARRHQLTLNTLLQGAWALLLSRYSGEPDVVFGVTVAGRPSDLHGADAMLGVFINTLPMRVRVAPATRLLQWLGDIQAQQLELRRYEYSPLVQVQGWSEVERGLPLFESILDFENHTLGGPLGNSAGRLTFSDVRTEIKMDYPLFIKATPDESLLLTISYDARRLDEEAIQRLVAHLQTLLASIVENPDAQLGTLNWLTPTERQHLLVTHNPTTRPDLLAPFRSLPNLFAEAARTRPNATAAVGSDATLTYAELDTLSTRLAHLLLSRTSDPARPIALCLPRTSRMLAALLGVLKAGLHYLPLDATYPQARLRYMLADSQPSLLLTERTLAARFEGCDAELLYLDELWETLTSDTTYAPELLPVPVEPDALAYVIYTSGSTGQPKGVMVTHAALSNLLLSMREQPGLDSEDRLLAVTTLGFDIAALELFLPLVVGGVVVVGREGLGGDAAGLATLIKEQGVTAMQATPSTWRLLVEGGWSAALSGVKVLCGGEAVDAGLAERLAESGREAWNVYGPTETTIWSATGRLGEGAGRVVVGRPIANTRAYVLDAALNPVPVGVSGELYLAGAGLARGYLKRAGLTAERFVPDPHGGEVGARMYRTGDVARWTVEGEIECLGRVDSQVKVRGYRIELGEIESVLLAAEGVRAAAVVVRGEGSERRLVGYVVREGGSGQEGGEEWVRGLKEGLRERLPEYMVPVGWVELGEMPLTANGKVDRRALPETGGWVGSGAREYEGPGTPVEEVLCGIFGEVLGVERVGVNDSFFELGGDSILSIQVASRASKADLQVTPLLLFQHRTVKELAAVVAPVAAGMSHATGQDLATGNYLLSPPQLWFFSQKHRRPGHWNQALLLALSDAPPSGEIARALSFLLRYHDALRLRFSHTARGWQQSYAAPDQRAPYTYIDLSALPPARIGPAIESASAQAQASLDLEHGPLFRALQFHAGAGAADRLLLCAHHLVVDAVSWRVLLEDLSSVCAQLGKGGEPLLPGKTTAYGEWAQALAEEAEGASVLEEAGYWAGELEGVERGRLPVDFAGGTNTAGSARRVEVTLDEAQTQRLLVGAAEVYRMGGHEVALAALYEALLGWSGRGEAVVDVEWHGREAAGADVSRTVGWMTSIYPVRVARGGGELGERLRGLKEKARGVPRGGRGYGQLRYVRQGSGGQSEEALRVVKESVGAEVSFNYLGQVEVGLGGGGLRMVEAAESAGAVYDGGGERPYLLEVEGRVKGGRLGLSFTYSENLHRRESVERLGGLYLDAVRRLVEHSRMPETGAHTPSDFPKAKLNQKELDDLLLEISGAADISS